MKVLFCHDGPLKMDENGIYYGTAHNDSTFKRYYSIAEKLKVIIRVTKITSKEATNKYSKITVSPFDVISYPSISSVKGKIFNTKITKKILKNEVEKADYIVARIPSSIGFLAIQEAQSQKKPYLIELVTCPWDAFWNHSVKGKLLAPFMYLKTKKEVSNASYVLYVTNSFLQKRYPTKGLATNCSNVALKGLENNNLIERISKIKNKDYQNEEIILGTTAAINVKFKGQKYVIQALGKLKKAGELNYRYQLVGSGDSTYLRKIARKHNVENQVDFLGPLPHEEVFEWLKKIDLYIQPSRQEGLPRALIEAMSLGVPAIGSKTAGIPELINSKYIFSNTSSNLDEITNIIRNFDIKSMELQAIQNFNEAHQYTSSIIEKRRKKFFEEFVENSYKK